jgi:uncharacterized membrane protein
MLVEIETGTLCEYCTVMQIIVIVSSILSLVWYLKMSRGEWIDFSLKQEY